MFAIKNSNNNTKTALSIILAHIYLCWAVLRKCIVYLRLWPAMRIIKQLRIFHVMTLGNYKYQIKWEWVSGVVVHCLNNWMKSSNKQWQSRPRRMWITLHLNKEFWIDSMPTSSSSSLVFLFIYLIIIEAHFMIYKHFRRSINLLRWTWNYFIC